MRGAASASRRFYHAFYRWHALTTCRHPHTHLRAALLPTCRRLTTSVAREEQDDAATPPPAGAPPSEPRKVRRQYSTPRSDTRRGSKPRDQDQDSLQRDAHAAFLRLPRQARDGPVLSPTDKPFDTFGEWELAVRYRSDTAMLLQLAVRTDELALLQEELGPQLEKLQQRYGARIETGATITTPDGVRLTSVTLSGGFAEIRSTHTSLGRHRASDFFFKAKAVSTDDLPSNAVAPWDKVMREVDAKFRKLEVIVPSISLPRLQKSLRPDDFAFQHRVTLTIAPVQRSDAANAVQTHSLFIAGEYPRVWRAYNLLTTYKQYLATGGAAPTSPYSMTLRVPQIPTGQAHSKPISMVVGKGGRQLKRLKRDFGVTIDLLDEDGMRLQGPSQSAVQQVKARVEQIVAHGFALEDLPPAPLAIIAESPLKEGNEAREDTQSPETAEHSAAGAARGARNPQASAPSRLADLNDPAVADGARTSKSARKSEETASGSEARRRVYSMTIAIPRVPDGQVGREPSKAVIGRSGRRLYAIAITSKARCFVVDGDSNTLRLTSFTKTAVSRALELVRKDVRKSFEEDGLKPIDVQVLEDTVTDEAPLPAESSASQPPDGTNEEDMKLALSSLAHPVVLVTAEMAEKGSVEDLDDLLSYFRGATVSSFNSVTLKPVPIVSFNVRTPSRTWDAIKSSSGFLRAHILSASPTGAALAHQFTLPHARPDEPFRWARRMGAHIKTRQERKYSPPRIYWPGAVLGTLRAKADFAKSVQVGDHMIVVAKVTHVNWAARENDYHAALSYSQRQYRTIGQPVEAATMPEAAFEDASASNVSAAAAPQAEQQAVAASGAFQHHVGAPPEEDSATAEDLDTESTPEETDVDYFQAIADDDDDDVAVDDAHEGQASPPSSRTEAISSEEVEYDFGFDVADEDDSAEQEPWPRTLVEDSDAAREEGSYDAHAEREGNDAQKRPAGDSSDAP